MIMMSTMMTTHCCRKAAVNRRTRWRHTGDHVTCDVIRRRRSPYRCSSRRRAAHWRCPTPTSYTIKTPANTVRQFENGEKSLQRGLAPRDVNSARHFQILPLDISKANHYLDTFSPAKQTRHISQKFQSLAESRCWQTWEKQALNRWQYAFPSCTCIAGFKDGSEA